jgi:hypothetical protein
MGKQGAHAHLVLGLEKIEFGFAVLLRDHVIGPDCDHSVGIAAPGNAEPYREIVAHVKKRYQSHGDDDDALHESTLPGKQSTGNTELVLSPDSTRCHPERNAEILRGVYPERSERLRMTNAGLRITAATGRCKEGGSRIAPTIMEGRIQEIAILSRGKKALVADGVFRAYNHEH